MKPLLSSSSTKLASINSSGLCFQTSGPRRRDVFVAGLHALDVRIGRGEAMLGEQLPGFLRQRLIVQTEHFLDDFLRQLGFLFEPRDAFDMRAHVAHHQIAILLDLRARRGDFTPGIFDVSKKIPEDMKSGALRQDKGRMGKRRRLNASLFAAKSAAPGRRRFAAAQSPCPD